MLSNNDPARILNNSHPATGVAIVFYKIVFFKIRSHNNCLE